MKNLILSALTLLSLEELIEIINYARGEVGLSEKTNNLLHELYSAYERDKKI